MRTSQEWWNEVKNDPVKFNEWLIKQYRGEVTAVNRIRVFKENFATRERDRIVLDQIINQEIQHANWILDLLESRAVRPALWLFEEAEKRYWKDVLPGIESFETGSAVAAHAEKMRLERIRVIAGDEDTPDDVRDVFKRILSDEEFHTLAFTVMSSPDALEATRHDHERGMEALGLVV